MSDEDKKMTKGDLALELLKGGAQFVVSTGAGAVVGNAIYGNIPIKAKLPKRLSIVIGGLVLSTIVGDYASDYVVDQIDKTAESYKTAKQAFLKAAGKVKDDVKDTAEKVAEAASDAVQEVVEESSTDPEQAPAASPKPAAPKSRAKVKTDPTLAS